MTGLCGICGRERNDGARFCGNCGSEFLDPPAATPADATRVDPPGDRISWTPPADATRVEQPGTTPQPDPYASWYKEGSAPAAPQAEADPSWQQPTETVHTAHTAQPAGYPPAAGQARRRRGGLAALFALLLVVVGGGAYALASALDKSSTGPSRQGGTSSASAAASASVASASPGSPATATATATATGTAAATPTPAVSLVAIGPGVSSAAVPQVETLLSRYFQGINMHDYAEYASTLNPQEQADQPQSKFDSGYATTRDSGMTLASLAPASGGGLAATVAFTSHQNPADGVDKNPCNTWTLTYYLVPQGSGYLIGPAPSGAPRPTYADC
jgi:hypothetical protein